jgi:hypothetical protein
MSTEKTQTRKFDEEYLNKLLQQYNAILLNSYEKLHGGVSIQFRCTCGNISTKLFRDIAYYGGAFCKLCVIKNKNDKIKKVCFEKYGVDNFSQAKEIKEKKEATYMENYGMHPKKTKEVQEKYKNTCLERYGVENTSQTTEVKEKIKKTFIENYGGHPMLNEEIKNKVKNTCFEKYGGYPAESQEVKDKMKETFFEHYGCYPTQSPIIQEKIKKINIDKYGCHPSQTPEVMEKIVHKSKSYKKYKMPSGIERNVQGYEPFALDLLLKEYTEEQIKTDRKDIPRIKYTFDNIKKYYFPDIYIEKNKLIIEVKSDWVYKLNKDINLAKKEATIAAGYNYEIWCFNRKGVKVEL